MLVVCIFASALGALIMCLLVLRDGFSPISHDPARADRDVLVTRLGHAVAGACFATTAILATVLVARTPAVRVVTAAPDQRVTERLTVLDRERQALGEQVTALGASVQAMREQVGTVGGGVESMRARLDQTESRVAKAEAGLQRLSDEVAQAIARARQVERPVAARPAAPAREVVVPPPARTPVRRIPADVEKSAESASPAPPEAASPAQVTHAPSVAPAPPAPPKPAAVAAPAPPAPKAPPAATATAPAPKAPPAAAATAPRDLPPTKLTDKMRNDWEIIRRGFATAGDEISSAVRKLGRRGDSGD
jgi:hypothetical protein